LDLGEISAYAVLIVIIASFPAVIWFFRFRKAMIRKQANLIRHLEERLRPRDQLYWYLGYLVGFRAKYRVGRDGVDNVYVLYTSPPYHVFFYLPVIWLFRKKERLEIILELARQGLIKGEAHIADERIRSVRISLDADIGDRSRYKRTTITHNGRIYNVYYTGGNALEKARWLLETASKHAPVYRVSVDGSRRSILVSFEPVSLEAIDKVLKAAWRAAKQ